MAKSVHQLFLHGIGVVVLFVLSFLHLVVVVGGGGGGGGFG